MSRDNYFQFQEDKKEQVLFVNCVRVLFGQIRRDAIYRLKIEQGILFPPEEHPERGPPSRRGSLEPLLFFFFFRCSLHFCPIFTLSKQKSSKNLLHIHIPSSHKKGPPKREGLFFIPC